jgi:hypothetical protein
MQAQRRRVSLGLLALPLAGCVIQPLPKLLTESAIAPATPKPLRPPALGQRWTYRKYNGFNSALLATEIDEIATVEPRVVIRRRSDAGTAVQEEYQQPWGQLQRDLSWDRVQNYEQAVPLWPSDLRPGARSVHKTYYRIDGFSYRYWISHHTKVVGWEHVNVAAGRFLALRIEHYIRLDHHDFNRSETVRQDTLWLAPEIGRWVVREVSGVYLIPDDNGSYRGLEANPRWELAAWA